MARILITGSNGQVGNALCRTLADHDLLACGLKQEGNAAHVLDLRNPEQIREQITVLKPHIIINPAAYTAVDKAEAEPELCHTVNHLALEHLGAAAKAVGAAVFHFSTDYVFDGSGDRPRSEGAQTNPLSVYGKSKLAGEAALISSGCRYFILRTSWVFSSHGQNFVKTMLRLAEERQELSIVADQIGAPTSAEMLAAAVASMIADPSLDSNQGLYHLTASGETSWHGFANSIFAGARKLGRELKISKVQPIDSDSYPTAATRPLNSRLDCALFDQTFSFRRPSWQQCLDEVLAELEKA